MIIQGFRRLIPVSTQRYRALFLGCALHPHTRYIRNQVPLRLAPPSELPERALERREQTDLQSHDDDDRAAVGLQQRRLLTPSAAPAARLRKPYRHQEMPALGAKLFD